jgi:hypothetical protein
LRFFPLAVLASPILAGPIAQDLTAKGWQDFAIVSRMHGPNVLAKSATSKMPIALVMPDVAALRKAPILSGVGFESVISDVTI